MSKASKTAIGGMATALSVVVLLLSSIDVLSITAAATAGIITLFCAIELSKGWACGVYAASAIISFLVLPNKECSLLYIAFFGYYPILKGLIESKIKNRVLEILLKFLIYNASIIAAEYILFRVMNVPLTEFLDVKDGSWLAQHIFPVLFAALNLVFIPLDYVYTVAATMYVKRYRKFFRKTFKFK